MARVLILGNIVCGECGSPMHMTRGRHKPGTPIIVHCLNGECPSGNLTFDLTSLVSHDVEPIQPKAD